MRLPALLPINMMTRQAIAAVMSEGPEEYRWAVRWQYQRPRHLEDGGFYDVLLEAAAHADQSNLRKIALGFPALANAVHKWRNLEGWAQEVEAWGEERARTIQARYSANPS